MLRLRMIAFTKQLQCKNLQDFIHLQLVQHSQCKSLPHQQRQKQVLTAQIGHRSRG